MKLAEFIDRLLEIQNEYDCDDVEVELMHEFGGKQYSSVVRDLAVSVGKQRKVSKIIIIGNEE